MLLFLPQHGARTPFFGRQLPQAVIEAPQGLDGLAIVQLRLFKGDILWAGCARSY